MNTSTDFNMDFPPTTTTTDFINMDFNTTDINTMDVNTNTDFMTTDFMNTDFNSTDFMSPDFTEFNDTDFNGTDFNATDELPFDSIPRVMNITLMTIGFGTVIMNIFVISIIAAYKWMRSPANLIICSMAVTDLMAGLVTLTAGMVKWTNWFQVPRLFCEIFFAVDIWAAQASLAHVLIVNSERYLAIVFPLKYKNITSVRRIQMVLALAWSITLAEATAYTFANTMSSDCLLIATPLPGLAFGMIVSSILIPFVSVISIYIHILIVIIKKMRFMAKSSNMDQIALARSQRKVFLTVSAILVAWIICWLPLMLAVAALTFAQAFHVAIDLSNFVNMFYYTEVMSYGNSLLNPILYFMTSAKFRKAAVLMFKCVKDSPDQVSTMSIKQKSTAASTTKSEGSATKSEGSGTKSEVVSSTTNGAKESENTNVNGSKESENTKV